LPNDARAIISGDDNPLAIDKSREIVTGLENFEGFLDE
jgi:hypothetical protein